VKTTIRPFTTVYRAALAAVCLFGLGGCRGDHSPGDAKGGDEDHVGHVIPAHKPKTFPEAVRSLKKLNDQIVREVAAGQPGASADDKTVRLALDVANWLPEIAARSDMPENPWNEVNARSAALVGHYKTVLSGVAAGNTVHALRDADKEIADLASLLDASDNRWFAGNAKVDGTPNSQ
jgi:hypothetical protein